LQTQEWEGECGHRCHIQKVHTTFYFESKGTWIPLNPTIYKEDPDFQPLMEGIPKDGPYTIREGFLFRYNKLCIPKCSLRELLV